MKKILLFNIPMSVCNFRCHYCYIAQRDVHFQGRQPEMRYSPEQVAAALSLERVGGPAFMNFCAEGETLLTKDLDKYIYPLVKQGHYAEIVTNLSHNPMLDKILSWEKEVLARVEFKCSFHYLELKRLGLLERFARNVRAVWDAGASANIEITPSDELIPFLDELKAFSLEHFGALPHITIARNDRTPGIEYLTSLSMEEYDRVWSGFGSGFWQFKRELFGVRRKEFCYAGAWSLFIDLASGRCSQCYKGLELGNAFAHPERPLPSLPIGRCRTAHCYNGHALLSMGLIPELDTPGYGDLRDRLCEAEGRHWLQPQLREFFNTKLKDSNPQLGACQKNCAIAMYHPLHLCNKAGWVLKGLHK
jgi:hypothetical protein